jgi:single-strand DNA-binding protein
MAGSLNKVVLIGNLGKDPEIRTTSDGKEIASFSLATSDVWKDKATGEKKNAQNGIELPFLAKDLLGLSKIMYRKAQNYI